MIDKEKRNGRWEKEKKERIWERLINDILFFFVFSFWRFCCIIWRGVYLEYKVYRGWGC